MSEEAKEIVTKVLDGDVAAATDIFNASMQQRAVDQVDSVKSDVIANIWNKDD